MSGEKMVRLVPGQQGFATGDRFVSSNKVLTYLRERIEAAEAVMNDGRCGDYAQYRQHVGARGELVRAAEFVEKLLKGKEDE